jgi:hypothetical protein
MNEAFAPRVVDGGTYLLSRTCSLARNPFYKREERRSLPPGLCRQVFALLAREAAGGLVYAGSAFVTLPQRARDEFWTRTEAIKIPNAVVPELRGGNRKASFVRPMVRVRARHLRGEGMLRHASLTALL